MDYINKEQVPEIPQSETVLNGGSPSTNKSFTISLLLPSADCHSPGLVLLIVHNLCGRSQRPLPQRSIIVRTVSPLPPRFYTVRNVFKYNITVQTLNPIPPRFYTVRNVFKYNITVQTSFSLSEIYSNITSLFKP